MANYSSNAEAAATTEKQRREVLANCFELILSPSWGNQDNAEMNEQLKPQQSKPERPQSKNR